MPGQGTCPLPQLDSPNWMPYSAAGVKSKFLCSPQTVGHRWSSVKMVSTLEANFEVKVEARRLWRCQLDAGRSLPIASGGLVESVEYESGNGDTGSIKIVKYGAGLANVTFSRELVEVVDHEKLILSYSIIGGELFDQLYSLYRGTLSFTPLLEPEGIPESQEDKPGSKGADKAAQPRTLVKWHAEYTTRRDAGGPEFAKAATIRLFKTIESWLTANPALYTERPEEQFEIRKENSIGETGPRDVHGTCRIPVDTRTVGETGQRHSNCAEDSMIHKTQSNNA